MHDRSARRPPLAHGHGIRRYASGVQWYQGTTAMHGNAQGARWDGFYGTGLLWMYHRPASFRSM